MKFKIVLGLVITAGLMMGCGTTTPVPEAQGSQPVTTRALSYNTNFAQNYVNLVVNTYSVVRFGWYGLEDSKARAVANLASGQTSPSRLRDGYLDSMLGFDLYGQSSNPDLQTPENYIDFLWQNYLTRKPDLSSRDYWVRQLIYGGMKPSQVRDVFINTLEYAIRFPNDQFVLSLYNQVLRRSAGLNEIQWWVNVLNSGVSRSDVNRFFLDSAEFGNCQFIGSGYAENVLWATVPGYHFPLLPGPLPPIMRCN